MRVMSMPDTWVPVVRRWDLAFQCVAFSLVDPVRQGSLWLLLFEQFQHPNASCPLRVEFGDLNPPGTRGGVARLQQIACDREPDRDWLERCFHKLLITRQLGQ